MRTLELAGLTVRLAGGTDREGGGGGPLVVLLHGYGAPGEDLVPLQRVLDVPRDVRFAFPAAPLEPSELAAYGGRAWWNIDVLALQQAARDFSREVPDGLAEARASVIELLDGLSRELQVPGERLILGGFSQGAMLACDLALRTDRPLAGLVLLSGTLLCRDQWQPLMAARSALPILQTHGLSDPLLPYAAARELRELWRAAGASVEWVEFPGGHELPDSVLDALAAFVRTHVRELGPAR